MRQASVNASTNMLCLGAADDRPNFPPTKLPVTVINDGLVSQLYSLDLIQKRAQGGANDSVKWGHVEYDDIVKVPFIPKPNRDC